MIENVALWSGIVPAHMSQQEQQKCRKKDDEDANDNGFGRDGLELFQIRIQRIDERGANRGIGRQTFAPKKATGSSGDGDPDQLSCEFKAMPSCSYSLTTHIVRIALAGAVTSRVGLLAPANRAGAFL